MRSLFIKIFLWFWFAMTLIGAAGVLLTLKTDPRATLRARYEKRLTGYGRDLVRAYETGGPEALTAQADFLDRKENVKVFLFKGPHEPLSSRRAPPGSRRMVAQVLKSGRLEHQAGKRGLVFALPLKGDLVVLAILPPPSRLALFFDHRNLGLRLVVTFVIGGAVCYILARSLTAPIGKLREATQQFARGSLDTRVAPDLGAPGGEIGDLACDFNDMAGRIEKLVDSQNRLVRDISHELRSPLARLNVALGLARRRAGEEAGEPLDRIELEAERLNDLIGELLSLSLMEQGERGLQREPIELETLVEEVIGDADFEAGDGRKTVDFVSRDSARISVSREILRRAIENVVRNAVRYTGKGTAVEITLRRIRDGADEKVVLAVRDHGPGVPESELRHIFRPFYRVAHARERQTGGTGVGLAIAYRALSLHGGTITASNAPGGGLIVEMTLPLG